MKTFQLTYDQVESIIIKELKETLVQFQHDYKRTGGVGVFANDVEEDRKIIKKHIKSLERIIEWYGGTV